MIPTLKILHNRRKNNRIEICISGNGKRRYLSTGIEVEEKNYKDGRIINRLDAPEQNERLQLIIRDIESQINDFISNKLPIDISALKIETSSENNGQSAFLKYIEKQITLNNNKEGTKKHYYTLLNLLEEFNRIRKFSDLTLENIKRFDMFLRAPYVSDGVERIRKASTVYGYHKRLKAVINMAVAEELVQKNPYAKMKNKIPRGEKKTITYLTEYEMKRLMDVNPLDKTETIAKDMFIFQMFTGLAYIDALNFDFSIYDEIDGDYFANPQRQKIGTKCPSQLFHQQCIPSTVCLI